MIQKFVVEKTVILVFTKDNVWGSILFTKGEEVYISSYDIYDSGGNHIGEYYDEDTFNAFKTKLKVVEEEPKKETMKNKKWNTLSGVLGAFLLALYFLFVSGIGRESEIIFIIITYSGAVTMGTLGISLLLKSVFNGK